MNQSASIASAPSVTPKATLLALVALGVMGVSSFLAMPVIVGALSGDTGYTGQQIARFSFVQLSSLSVGCVLSIFLSRFMSLKALAILSLVGLIVADAVSPLTQSYGLFLFLRAIAGISGGIAVATTTAALGRTASADRAFGWFLFAQIAFQMLATFALPQLVLALGKPAVFMSLAAAEALVLIALVHWIPRVSITQGAAGSGGNDGIAWIYSVLMLASILTFFMAIGAFWTFVGRIGEESAGLTAAVAGRALSIAAIGGLVGAFLPAILGARLGRTAPMIVATLGLVGGLLLMDDARGFAPYVIAALAFSFGWFLLYPFQLGLLAAIDKDGRATMLSAALTGAGLGIGPAIVAQYLPEHGLRAPYSVALTCVIIAVILAIGISALLRLKPPVLRPGSDDRN